MGDTNNNSCNSRLLFLLVSSRYGIALVRRPRVGQQYLEVAIIPGMMAGSVMSVGILIRHAVFVALPFLLRTHSQKGPTTPQGKNPETKLISYFIEPTLGGGAQDSVPLTTRGGKPERSETRPVATSDGVQELT